MNTQDTVHRKSAAELRIRRVMDALEKNNMQAYYAPTCADAVKIAKELLQPGDVISCGGSVTLDETGVMDLWTEQPRKRPRSARSCTARYFPLMCF